MKSKLKVLEKKTKGSGIESFPVLLFKLIIELSGMDLLHSSSIGEGLFLNLGQLPAPSLPLLHIKSMISSLGRTALK